ncbi:MAG: type I methionyl aminopeptidase [Candidatus Latescibacteria bacterium]|nr:type I methionyl aminopeptidase [Candidatus Latescibacterota bacterium]
MSIDSPQDLAGLTRAGRAVAQTLQETRRQVRPGITTAQLDRIAAAVFRRWGARSAPALAYGFPGTILISVNDEVVHGIPSDRMVQPGDLVKVDVTAEVDGYIADAASTVAVPPVTRRHRRLCQCARSAFNRALDAARAGRPLNHIGRAVEREVDRRGFTVLPELHGHGIGRQIHEEPTVPNYYDRRDNQPLTEGLVITIEPLISTGSNSTFEDTDGWTVRTADGSFAAHHEHTLVITGGRPLILTAA